MEKMIQRVKRVSAVAILAALILGISVMESNGQSKSSPAKAQLGTAIELYENGAYKNALTELNKVIKQKTQKNSKASSTLEKAEGYKVLCIIELRQSNITSSVNAFQKKYPTSSLIPKIKYEYGNFLIATEKYQQAINTYKTLNTKQLDDHQQSMVSFNRAYALFKTKKTEEANKEFTQLIQNPKTTTYNRQAARFYKGYIEYSNKNFASAIKLLEESSSDARFTELSQYYLLDSKFMLKDYQYVIEKGSKMVDAHIDDASEAEDDGEEGQEIKNKEAIGKMARVVAEAYYQKNNLKEANKYFSIYSSYVEELSREDRLFMGTLAYNTEDYANAAKNLAYVCNTEDSICQNASYRLAESYIKLKNKEEALKAFEKAATLKYDSQIEEDAAFNHAKLYFELTGEIAPLEQYIANYKTSNAKKDEIYSYIAASAINNKDYDYALEALGKIGNKKTSDNLNAQKANLLKGDALLSAGSHHLAKGYLQRAMNGSDKNVSNLASLLYGEALYRDSNYQQSLGVLGKLKSDPQFQSSSNYPMLYFNTAYNYFKLRNFQEAEKNFEEYINLTHSGQNTLNPIAEEAKIRIADCRFLLKDYPVAVKMYKKIASSDSSSENEKDMYPVLQGAMAYGLMGKNSDKIATLRHYTTTEYKYNKQYSQLLYELSKAQVQNNEDGPAITTLIKLVYNPPDSLYLTQAMLDIALINANRGSYDQAINYCQKVLEHSPNSKEGESALKTMENCYLALRKPEEFYTYVQQKDLLKNKSEQEQEAFVFNSAEQIYLTGKNDAAISALTSYLGQFGDGANSTKALYYLSNCYGKENNLKKSAAYLDMIIQRGNSPYYEDALLGYANICYANQQFDEAIENYDKLEISAKNSSNQLAAIGGLVKSHYHKKEFDKAVDKANQLYVRSMSQNLVKEKEEALYYKAKSLIAQGFIDDAASLLEKVADNPNSSYGAEANYLLIQKAFNRGEFKKVEDLVFAFANTKTEQTYWLAKSYLLLGDSYKEQGSQKKAIATYKSLEENYDEDDDIAQQVKSRLEKNK